MSIRTLNRQYNRYDHADDYVEDISHKLLTGPELFINSSVTLTVYSTIVWTLGIPGLYLLVGVITMSGKQLLCI